MRDFQWVYVIMPALIACGEPAQVPLAEIERVEPETLEPGDILRITGNGFVEGSVDVVLSGSLKTSSSNASSHRKVRLKGIAVSEHVIEIALSEQTLKQFIEETTEFEGTLEADFDVQSSVRLFAKKDNVLLEFNPGGAGVKAHARKTREAEAALQAFGIRLASRAEVNGLVVAATTPESPAANAGIEFGDRLLSLDEKPLMDVSDFARATPSQNHVFEMVTREGLVRRVSVRPALFGDLESDELSAIILSSIAFGFFLATAAPTGRRFRRVKAGPRDPFVRAVAVGFVSLLLCLIPAVILFVYDGPLIWPALLGGHAAGVIALFLIGEKRSPLSLLHLVTVPAVVAASLTLCSGASPLEAAAAGFESPLGLSVSADPFMSASAVLSLFLIWPPLKNVSGSGKQDLAALFQLLSAAFCASAVTLCLFGGWSIPFVFDRVPLDSALTRSLACVIFMLKVWLVSAVSRRLSHFTQNSRKTSAASPLAPSLLVVCSGASILWGLTKVPIVFQTAGQVVAASMFAAAISFYIATELKGRLARREIGGAEIQLP